MDNSLTPKTAEQVLDIVRWALSSETPLEVLGAGSKRALGRPVAAKRVLDLSALSGVELYEHAELVMTAKAATPIAEIEKTLAENHQQLAFEPPDLGPLLGGDAGQGTIGGAIACNLSGPRRIKAGAARDHILGFQAVSGRAEAIKSGGRVVKNVTGFDLSKLITGSFGSLSVLTDVTFRVLPAPEIVRTLVLSGTNYATAVEAMTLALQSPYDVSGAAHLSEATSADGRPTTAIRLEGPEPSVDYRLAILREQLSGFGEIDDLADDASRTLWWNLRDVVPFVANSDSQVWRISVAPSRGAEVAGMLERGLGGKLYMDWGGGLIWLAIAPRPDAAHNEIRAIVGDGHATLIRADETVRADTPVFHPQPGPLAALNARIRESFDPKSILNPGRMVRQN